ncbi:MAG: HDOD domain-containing protein [Archangium sp.]|nr:HDOD domain-containing protein [Archangium sp.]
MNDHKPRILFVDDDLNILDAFRNLLRRNRKEWDLVFAADGAAALETLEREPCDIIVTDMRMPGMDGPELLERIRDRWPGTGRVVLSGHAETEAMVRAAAASHQFLAKPCSAEQLRQVLTEMLALQTHWTSNVRRWISSTGGLPAAPSVYLELVRVSASEKSSTADLARVVERDPALASNVLRLVNSPYFGARHPTHSLRDAVVRLGNEVVKAVALSSSLAEGKQVAIGNFSLEGLQRESFLVASVAQRVVKPSLREVAFCVGIVHEIGRLVFATHATSQFSMVLTQLKGRQAYQVEREVLGVTHGEVGAYLLSLWGLPRSICEAVQFHDTPREAPEPNEVLTAIHFADAIVHEPDAPHLDQTYLLRAGVTAALPAWLATVAQHRAEHPELWAPMLQRAS